MGPKLRIGGCGTSAVQTEIVRHEGERERDEDKPENRSNWKREFQICGDRHHRVRRDGEKIVAPLQGLHDNAPNYGLHQDESKDVQPAERPYLEDRRGRRKRSELVHLGEAHTIEAVNEARQR